MPSLLDIAPPELSAEDVDVRGVKLRVQGLSARQWAGLYARFPDLRAQMAGRQEQAPTAIDSLRSQAAMIAAGLGQDGNPEIERAVVERLSLEDQNQVIAVILRLSLPGHVFGPLLDAAQPESGVPAGAAPATKLQKRSKH